MLFVVYICDTFVELIIDQKDID